MKNLNYEIKNKQKIDKFYFKENLDIKKNFIISENISFKFKSKKEILNNINFSISEGETICITGALLGLEKIHYLI